MQHIFTQNLEIQVSSHITFWTRLLLV